MRSKGEGDGPSGEILGNLLLQKDLVFNRCPWMVSLTVPIARSCSNRMRPATLLVKGASTAKMNVDITIKNYRSFEDSHPARLQIGDGFTAVVGPNNAGKSSILRFFYELRHLFTLLGNIEVVKQGINGESTVFTPVPEVLDNGEIFCKFNERDLEITFETTNAAIGAKNDNQRIATKFVVTIPRNRNVWSLRVVLSGAILQANGGTFAGSTYQSGIGKVDFSNSLEIFRRLARTLYIPSFRNAINLGSNGKFYDITTGQAFVQSWRRLKTGNRRQDNEAAADVTELIRKIFGYKRLEINASENNETLQILVDGRSYGLHELGSGFSQFVLTLINAATERPAYVLIDEPELSLHATLQLQFLTTLGSFAQNGVLFATHSLGLARMAAENIYSIVRPSGGGSELRKLTDEPRLPELLGELSFSGYRELGFDGVLLVEGATDVKLFLELLRKYRKDGQFIIVPLGGDGLIKDGVETELAEVKRISENVVALIDSEKTNSDCPLPESRQAFLEVCARVNIKCYVLDRRAIENYFTDSALKHVLGEKYQALKPYTPLEAAEFGWAKSQNWRIASAMTVDELNETDLGEFLESL